MLLLVSKLRSISAAQLYPIILGHFVTSPQQKPLVLPLVVGQNTYILSNHFVTSLNTGQIYSFTTSARFLTIRFLLPTGLDCICTLYVSIYACTLYLSSQVPTTSAVQISSSYSRFDSLAGHKQRWTLAININFISSFGFFFSLSQRFTSVCDFPCYSLFFF